MPVPASGKVPAWVASCKDYQNLRGLSCKDVDAFLHRFPSARAVAQYRDFLKEKGIRDDRDSLHSIMSYPASDKKLRQEVIDKISAIAAEDKFDLAGNHFFDSKMAATGDPDEVFRDLIGNGRTREWASDELKRVKTFDRGEMLAEFMALGDKLAATLHCEDAKSPDVKKCAEGVLKLPREEIVKIREKQLKFRHDTYYITTPKGGLEMLGIFAYANLIPKEQIPGFISRDPQTGEQVGENWMGHGDLGHDVRPQPVRKVVFVDDVVSTGEQVRWVEEQVAKVFGTGKVELYSVHLCHHADPMTRSPFGGGEKMRNPLKGEHVFFAHSAYNWQDRSKPQSCVFPHGCSDHDEDRVATELYGRRCSPRRKITDKI